MQAALNAAQRVAQRFHIQPDRCDVLQDAHTLVVRFTESLVARIVTDTEGPRCGTAWLARETDIASHLSLHRAPIIPMHPQIPPIAHVEDGFAMNFWTFVHAVDALPSANEIGATLHHCHQVLQSYQNPLSELAILHESLAILNQQVVRTTLSQAAVALLQEHLEQSITKLAHLPHQALHGDAHMGNLMMTSEGLLWTDWEDCFLGPVEWDVASVIWNAKILNPDPGTVDAILNSYQSCGTNLDTDALQQCLIARAAVMCAWYPILYPDSSPERRHKLAYRLDWLRTQQR